MTGRKPKWSCINEDTQGRRGLALMKKKNKKKVVVQPKYIYRAGGCAEVSGLAGAELSCRISSLEQKGYAKEIEGKKKKTIKNRERGKKKCPPQSRKLSFLSWATATLPQLCWHCFHYTYFHHTPGTTNLRWAKKGEKEKLKQDKREGARCLLREGEMELQQTTRLFLATRKSLAEYKKKKKRDDFKRTFWLAGSTWLACSEQAQNTVGERKKTLCLTLRAASMTEHNNLKPKQKTRRKKKEKEGPSLKKDRKKKKRKGLDVYMFVCMLLFFF